MHNNCEAFHYFSPRVCLSNEGHLFFVSFLKNKQSFISSKTHRNDLSTTHCYHKMLQCTGYFPIILTLLIIVPHFDTICCVLHSKCQQNKMSFLLYIKKACILILHSHNYGYDLLQKVWWCAPMICPSLAFIAPGSSLLGVGSFFLFLFLFFCLVFLL